MFYSVLSLTVETLFETLPTWVCWLMPVPLTTLWGAGEGRRKITPYPITILNNPSKSCALSAYLAKLLGVIIIKVIGIGNKNLGYKLFVAIELGIFITAATLPLIVCVVFFSKTYIFSILINFFRFNFQNSHFISSSNPLTPCHPLKIVLKTFSRLALRKCVPLFVIFVLSAGKQF